MRLLTEDELNTLSYQVDCFYDGDLTALRRDDISRLLADVIELRHRCRTILATVLAMLDQLDDVGAAP